VIVFPRPLAHRLPAGRPCLSGARNTCTARQPRSTRAVEKLMLRTDRFVTGATNAPPFARQQVGGGAAARMGSSSSSTCCGFSSTYLLRLLLHLLRRSETYLDSPTK
jgi:hypothetical protein